MTKGHNKEKNDVHKEHKGGQEHLKHKARKKATITTGRSNDPDPAMGRKGKNSI